MRDEYKETEGNPAVKMRIRRLQRQARRRRMLKEVERAAVVITNPTEFAIALEFSVEMAAPVVVAKGRNLLAAQIREVALSAWHSAGGEPTPGARALSRGGSRTSHPTKTLCGGGRNSCSDLARAGARGPIGGSEDIAYGTKQSRGHGAETRPPSNQVLQSRLRQWNGSCRWPPLR